MSFPTFSSLVSASCYPWVLIIFDFYVCMLSKLSDLQTLCFLAFHNSSYPCSPLIEYPKSCPIDLIFPRLNDTTLHRTFVILSSYTPVALSFCHFILGTLHPTLLVFMRRFVPASLYSAAALFLFHSIHRLLHLCAVQFFGSSSATFCRLLVYLRLEPSLRLFFPFSISLPFSDPSRRPFVSP